MLKRGSLLIKSLPNLNRRPCKSTATLYRQYTTPTNPIYFTASNSVRQTPGEKYIYDKLTEKFKPSRLHVQDISGGCGDMYAIEISSEAFQGLPTIKQHRLVNELLKDDIKKMHGLQLKTST